MGLFGKRKLGVDCTSAEEKTKKPGNPVPIATDPGDKRKQDLWDYVQKFVRDQKITSMDDIGHLIRNDLGAEGFIRGCSDIVGYHKED